MVLISENTEDSKAAPPNPFLSGFEFNLFFTNFRPGSKIYLSIQYGPLVKRSRRRPLTAKTGVRFPYGSPKKDTSNRMYPFFVKLIESNPGRVFYVKKTVRWTVFSKMSLSGSESQSGFCPGKRLSIPLWVTKAVSLIACCFIFYCRQCRESSIQQTAKSLTAFGCGLHNCCGSRPMGHQTHTHSGCVFLYA